MRLFFSLVFAVTVLFACGSKNEIPKGVLSREKMRVIIWDMMRADNFLKDFMLDKDSTLNDTTESIKMYERVFQYNKTTREEFAKSFSFYRTHPVLMKEILDSLNVTGQQAPSELYKSKQAADTLKKVL